MSFLKKILVLKQIECGYSLPNKTLSGLCRFEIENGVCDLFLTVINILPKEEVNYSLLVVDCKKRAFFFELGKRPLSSKFNFINLPNIEKGVACGIFAESDNIPLTIAFAVDDGFNFSISDFNKIIAEKCLQNRKNLTKKDLTSSLIQKEKTSESDLPINLSNAYNDEAVATENYYDFDSQLDYKLNAIKEWNNEDIRLPNEQTSLFSQEEAQEEFDKNNFAKNEKDTCSCKKYSSEFPYYLTVKNELDAIFNKFESENCLIKLFPHSNFVKINYAIDKHYVVGLINEDDKPKYICYGVPGKYSTTAPKELDGFCTFIPLSIFDLSGDGYWMMFQDAVFGCCIKPSPSNN